MESAKVVYFGPALSGMTTSIGWIVAQQGAPPRREDTGACMGSVQLTRLGGRTLRLELFRPPMHLYRDPVRTEVLDGVDGVVFVADSQELRGEANVEALEVLEGIVAVHGRRLADVPMVLQYNKRDLAALPAPPAMLSVEELDRMINFRGLPRFESIATRGVGVLEALEALADLLVARAGK